MDPPVSTGNRTAQQDVVAVLLPLALSAPYDYAVPPGFDPAPGTFVEVPLGPRRMTGVVWGPGSGAVDRERLRPISRVFDSPPMPAAAREFIAWIADYTLAPIGAVLRMAMSVRGALAAPKTITAWTLAGGVSPDSDALPGGLRLTAARRRVIRTLADRGTATLAEIVEAAAVSPAVVRGLAAAALLRRATVSGGDAAPAIDPARPGPPLSAGQRSAAAGLTDRIGGSFSVSLLDGVTGSGKTEVYFEAVAAAIAGGRQVLVLLPEIAFAAEWMSRFETRFGAPPAVWHSGIPDSVRRRNWRAVLRGEAQLVVGARSALLLPFPNLGLIVVDEEHDPSYKQEDGVIYNARDMAVVRGRIGSFPVVLASATPSLETFDNVERGRYRRLELPARHGGARLPAVAAIDMRREVLEARTWISPTLSDAVRDTLAAGEQAMLFLNRRGYAPLTLCRSCGYRFGCPNCTAWLVEHRSGRRLQCHHCGYEAPPPRACPECGETDMFAAVGPGVERLEEEVRRRFPEARAEVMSSDTLRQGQDARGLVRRMRDREIDILIGTQIMAKGFHFPHLTLVGAVDADLGLAGGDLRAAERTYQVLHQVGGRAGRAERPGRVLIQTWEPGHPVMEALVAGDRDRFIEVEARARWESGMPPYGRLAAVIVHGPREDRVDETAARLGRSAPRSAGVTVLGPAPAPVPLIRGRHRRRLLLRARRNVSIQKMLRPWIFESRPPSGVRVDIDVDPYSFL